MRETKLFHLKQNMKNFEFGTNVHGRIGLGIEQILKRFF